MRAFPDAPAHNGVAAYQPQLLRLTIRVWEFLFSLFGDDGYDQNFLLVTLHANQTLDLPLFNF